MSFDGPLDGVGLDVLRIGTDGGRRAVADWDVGRGTSAHLPGGDTGLGVAKDVILLVRQDRQRLGNTYCNEINEAKTNVDHT